MNHTIKGLIYSHIFHRSPLILLPLQLHHSFFDIKSSKLSHSLSSFLYSVSSKRDISISNSEFSNHLSSVIKITSYDYKEKFYDNHINDPYTGNSLDSNLNIIQCAFCNNVNDFFGGALWLSDHSLATKISDSTFLYNKADLGGAIMIVSKSGSLSVLGSQFMNNSARQGSHILASCPDCYFNQVTFLKSNGSSPIYILGNFDTNAQILSDYDPGNVISTIISRLPESSGYHLSGDLATAKAHFEFCSFFANEGCVYISSGSMENCCLFMIEKTEGYFFMSGSSVELSKCCINLKSVESGDQEITATWTDKGDETCLVCQIIPTPSMTVNAKWNHKESILSLVSLIIFAFLSVVGIIFSCLEICTKCSRSANHHFQDDELLVKEEEEEFSEEEETIDF